MLSFVFLPFCSLQLKARETAAVIARELAEQTKSNLQAGDITYTVNAMVQLVDLLDVQLRNLTPGGKDSAARSLNKVAKETRNASKGLANSLCKHNPKEWRPIPRLVHTVQNEICKAAG